MLKLHLLSVGKTKETWLTEACAEYIKRLSPIMTVRCSWCKTTEELLSQAEQEKVAIYLDPAGDLMNSFQFSKYLYSRFEEGGSRLALVIGGAEGFPLRIKNSKPLISLSPLTMTHQLTRLMLLEQVYRAVEIRKGSSYHK